jgi:hypothetical protein
MTTPRDAAILLFNGWGYNWYRTENVIRADDLLVRQKLSAMLLDARRHLGDLAADYRRDQIPTPTRANPFPDRDKVAHVQTIDRASTRIAEIETALRSGAAPEADRIWNRFRSEKSIMTALSEHDLAMAGTIHGFVTAILDLTDSDALRADIKARVDALLAPVVASVKAREDMLRVTLAGSGTPARPDRVSA